MGGAPPAGSASPWLQRLRTEPRLPLILGVAALAAAAAAFVLWGQGPDYKVLYSNVTDRDGGAIIASLQQMNVPYRFAEGGTAILVDARRVPEVRMRLAAQGLPKAGGVGFELMDAQKFGTSQFAEQVNFQRALQGELARSIASIGTVSSARVHLAMPKPSLFVREQRKPSASVVLTLQPGRAIDEGQVSAIVHMVSSSVPGLDAKNVTVVDQRGNLLSAAGSGARGLDVSQLRYAQEIEQHYARRIEAILQPVVGAGNVRAQVAAELDFSVSERTDETYKPNPTPETAAVRSRQSSESSQHGVAPPGGVPGALSNQPPPAPEAPIDAPEGAGAGEAAAAPAGPRSARQDATVNYELDRTIRHVQQGAGTVRRLSVAVVVNHRTHLEDGQPVARALSDKEIAQVRELAKEAMGFSAERGDSLNVVNSAFVDDDDAREPPAPDLPFWRDPANLPLALVLGRYLLIGLALLFAWRAVLRPLLRKHLAPPVPPAAPLGASAPPAAQDESAASPAPSAQEALRQREAERQRSDRDYALQTATRDPRLVASLVQHWMNADDDK